MSKSRDKQIEEEESNAGSSGPGAPETHTTGAGARDASASVHDPTADALQALTTERDQLHNQLQRTLADLQNFRKRRVQEMADARRATIEALVAELLPVLDNFHLATDIGDAGAAGGEGTAGAIREGLLMVRGLLEGVFERNGVAEIHAAGAIFDPTVHEAVGIDPDPDAPEGVVSKVLQRGYTLDGRVLRPSRVLVGGANAPPALPGSGAADGPDRGTGS